MSRSLGSGAWPAWLREIDSLLAVYPQYVLSGNVRDRYLLPAEGQETGGLRLADNIAAALAAALRQAVIEAVLVYDPVDGYQILADDEEAAWAELRTLAGHDLETRLSDDLGRLTDVVRMFATGRGPKWGLVLDYAGQLTAEVNDLSPPEHAFFTACLKFSHEAVRNRSSDASVRALYNPIFWIVEREHDLPAWLTAGNRGIRAIQVPWPTLTERETTAGMLTGADRGGRRAEAAKEIASRTDGMTTANLFDLATLFVDQEIEYEDAEDAVRVYTFGAATRRLVPRGG